MTKKQIPRYFLYREVEPVEGLEFVHCEPLFGEMQEKNWEIAPHHHIGLHQLFYLRQGQISTTLDSLNTTLEAPLLLSLPANSVHGFSYDPKANGMIVTIANAAYVGAS